HQTGVIHRDVKPSNIFGAPETGIRLGDFGIAIARNEVAVANVSGTLGYMAPEQLRGEETTRATDVFGAGATAFSLRYGRYPFRSVGEALDIGTRPLFAAPQNPVVGYFQRLIEEMLQKEPGRRPAKASACAHHFSMISKSLRSGSRNAPLITVDAHTFRLGNVLVKLYAGDISTAKTDAIVCSANYEMKMRSGVGQALRARGGDCIEEEAMKDGEHALGSCVATGPGSLPVKTILHAVGAWNEASCIGRAAQRVFLLADEMSLKSLAMPALGTGIARVSLERCANAMMTALKWHVLLGGSRLEEVHVVLENEAKLKVFQSVAEEALRDEDDAPELVDLGLPVIDVIVRGDSSTHIDIGAFATATLSRSRTGG
ncbi:MAG: macro domain-containing protein, partial [Polyangiaceae bacterium]